MRILLLLLIGGLASYAVREFLGPYQGLEAITVPGGARYEVMKAPDDCQLVPGHCVARFAFSTTVEDTVALRKEAEGLLPWVRTHGAGDGSKAVILIGVKPGFARLLKPRFAAGMVFLWHEGKWNYGGAQILPLDMGLKGS